MQSTASLDRLKQKHPAAAAYKAFHRQWCWLPESPCHWQCWRGSQSFVACAVLLGWLLCVAGDCVADDRADKPDGDREPPRCAAGDDIGSSRANQHPLHHIGSLMGNVKARLHGRDTSQETRALQRSIVDGLSRLIDSQSESTSQQSSTTGRQQPPRSPSGERPGAASGDAASQSLTGGPTNKDSLLQQVWGHLPDRVRQQMETPLHEKFLPQYDKVIQDYFERLATEDSE